MESHRSRNLDLRRRRRTRNHRDALVQTVLNCFAAHARSHDEIYAKVDYLLGKLRRMNGSGAYKGIWIRLTHRREGIHRRFFK